MTSRHFIPKISLTRNPVVAAKKTHLFDGRVVEASEAAEVSG